MKLSEDPRFEINRMALDTQWEEQPMLYLEHAERLAEANAAVDAIKDELERLKAEVDGEARGELSRNGKFTEAMVASYIALDERMETKMKELREAQREAAACKADVIALDHRKSALENLVRLHGQEYFSVPVSTPEDRATHNKNRANSAVRNKLNNPKRRK